MRKHCTPLVALLAVGGFSLFPFACTSQKPAPAASGGTAGTGGGMIGKIRPAAEKRPVTDEAVNKNKDAAAKAAQDAREKARPKTFEQFEASVYKEPGPNGKYIVNGDTPIADRKHLREFFEATVKKEPLPRIELTMGTENGVETKWSNADKKHITYCVSTTFGSRQAKVIADMQAASGAWMQFAGVVFTHVPSEDANCTASNNNVVFDVRPVNVNGQYLARAFFPNDSRAARNVLIDETAFQMNPGDTLQLVGILRHELGHTLGLRHEQTRPEAGTCFEDNDWTPLTKYDRFSVMHYPQCNGGGDWSLTLTDCDKKGIACAYGPATGFQISSVSCTLLATCQAAAPSEPPPTGNAKTKKFTNQRVSQDQKKRYTRFRVTPGTPFKVDMTGHGTSPGDPDLYVKFDQAPDLGWSQYDCRPFLTGPAESCALDVPANASKAFIMVHGYTPGRYDLTVIYTGQGQ